MYFTWNDVLWLKLYNFNVKVNVSVRLSVKVNVSSSALPHAVHQSRGRHTHVAGFHLSNQVRVRVRGPLAFAGRAHCSLRVFFFAYFTVHTAPDHSDPAITWLAPRLHPGPSLASGSALRVPSRKLAGRPRVRVDLQLSSSIERASAFGSAPREARRVD